MLLTDFAAARGEKPDTVRKYINRHLDEYRDHISGNRMMELDGAAVAMLEKQYPLPAPVEVVEDTESRRQLIQAQKMIIQLQQQIGDMQALAARAEAQQILIEDKDRQLEAAEQRIDKVMGDVNVAHNLVMAVKEKNKDLESEVRQLRRELEQERRKTWWDKLRGR